MGNYQKNDYKKLRYSIERACGHKEYVTVGGYSPESRAAQVAVKKQELCTVCKQKKKQEQYKKEIQKAIKKEKELALPELEGTLKQIQWATIIRLQFVDSIKKQFDQTETMEWESTKQEKDYEKNKKIIKTFIEKEISAKVWIEKIREFTAIPLLLGDHWIEAKEILDYMKKRCSREEAKDDELISVAEYAKLHNLEPATVRQRLKRGATKGQKVGRNWVIKRSEELIDHREKNNRINKK